MNTTTNIRERDDLQGKLNKNVNRESSPNEPSSFEIETEELDPRVKEELEKLNQCTDEINRFCIKC